MTIERKYVFILYVYQYHYSRRENIFQPKYEQQVGHYYTLCEWLFAFVVGTNTSRKESTHTLIYKNLHKFIFSIIYYITINDDDDDEIISQIFLHIVLVVRCSWSEVLKVVLCIKWNNVGFFVVCFIKI